MIRNMNVDFRFVSTNFRKRTFRVRRLAVVRSTREFIIVTIFSCFCPAAVISSASGFSRSTATLT